MSIKSLLCFLIFALVSVSPLNIYPQTENPLDRYFSIGSSYEELGTIDGTKNLLIKVYIDIAPGYSVYAESLDIKLSIDAVHKIEKTEFPKPEKRFDKFLKKDTDIFKGDNTFKFYLAIPEYKKLKDSKLKYTRIVTYHGRSNTKLYSPITATKEKTIELSTGGMFENLKNVSKILEEKGFLLALLAVFLLGMLASLTPCVYPMVPIVVAVITAKAMGSKLKGFKFSVLFALGIALVYSLGGFIAAKSGSIVGSFFQSSWGIIFVVAIFLAMGLSLLGLFEFKLPYFITKRISGIKNEGYFSIFIMGLVTGLVAVPCVGPFAGSLLTFVAETGNPLKGFILLFSFSIGLSVLFILIGTFSSLLTALPKPGSWMVILKKVLGFLLIGASLYYLNLILPAFLFPIIIGVFLLLIALILQKLDSMQLKLIEIFHKRASEICLVLGILVIVIFPTWNYVSNSLNSKEEVTKEKINWLSSPSEAFKLAKTSGKPLMLDFYATWCEPCKAFDKKTLSDRTVIEKSKGFISLRLDVSKDFFDGINEISQKYSVYSLPTLLFLNSKGDILENYRTSATLEPLELLETMNEVINSTNKTL